MEITTTTINRNPGRRAAVTALAIFGFIALIIIGIGLAIYTARYAPKLGSKLNGAAVSLSSVFRRDSDDASLEVVTATSTIPFEDESIATSTLSVATSTTGTKPSTGGTAGTAVKYRTVTTTTTVAPYGDPDLTVKITDVGYLTRKNDTDTFVASNSVSSGRDGAVKFTVKNIGTNVTGSWKFQLSLPTGSSNTTFTSPTQDSLKPGESVDYVLGFQHTKSNNSRDITIKVDSGKNVRESDEDNNTDSDSIDLK